MKYIFLFACALSLSCTKEKTVLLPEITNAKITEITDVSAAYLFYDKTKTDSIELNRKNLISTTNWLINVDKRLTLAQAIPQVMFLQDKKRNAELHKNENAKNYYTCNDTSINNLGFIEFTSIIYKLNHVLPNVAPDYQNEAEKRLILDFSTPNDIKFVTVLKDSILKKTTLQNITKNIKKVTQDAQYELILNINKQLKFQDYITFKSALASINSENISINENEFIY